VVSINNCKDHWCENYGKDNEKCDRCNKKQSEQEKTDINVVLKRRTYHLMGVDKDTNIKGIGQER